MWSVVPSWIRRIMEMALATTIKNGVIKLDWKTRIIVDPGVMTGKPVIKGTRITVEFVMELLGRGATVTEILHEYDHLTPEDIQACLAYASDLVKSERIYVNPT